MLKACLIFIAFFFACAGLRAQDTSAMILRPARVFDGERMHEDWSVWISSDTITYVGPSSSLPAASKKVAVIQLAGQTLLPGLIEGHSHLFLHPYNETPWDDQVLKESRAERTARAVVHAKNTLMAGFTTVRDLGTEGAVYDDVGLKAAIRKGVVPGPSMLVSTRAIVATGSYGPRSASNDVTLYNPYPLSSKFGILFRLL
jgi:imidazolonepropionase-like amidohydrolase